MDASELVVFALFPAESIDRDERTGEWVQLIHNTPVRYYETLEQLIEATQMQYYDDPQAHDPDDMLRPLFWLRPRLWHGWWMLLAFAYAALIAVTILALSGFTL